MELRIGEFHKTAQHDFAANSQPAFLCPYTVQRTGEREHLVLVLVKVFDRFPEHIP